MTPTELLYEILADAETILKANHSPEAMDVATRLAERIWEFDRQMRHHAAQIRNTVLLMPEQWR